MIISTKGIVLSKIKFRDNDLIIKCYTFSKGVTSFLVKGAFASKKHKLQPAYFQPLSLVNIEITYKENRDLQYIKAISINQSYKSMHTEILKSTVAIFISEVLTNVLKEEESNEVLYNYIETALLWFDTVEQSSIFHLQFLIGLTKYIGILPELSNKDLSVFNLETGCYQKTISGPYCISGSKLIMFNSILGMKFDKIKAKPINTVKNQELLNIILVYYKLHLQNFKFPKSLAVLQQVFN